MLLYFSLAIVLLTGDPLSEAHAQSSSKKKKTVGQLLDDISKKRQKYRPDQLKKQKSALPVFGRVSFDKNAQPVNLQSVRPPSKSRTYYPAGTDEAELERVTDQGIAQLYRLSQENKRSSARGEIWLRLAEMYVEKARLIEYRIQAEYDRKLGMYQAKKLKVKPTLNIRVARDYNKKAIQLYEWFLRDFPKDNKADQALFFLGFNYFEMGEEEKGRTAYERLTKEYPRSTFIVESYFSLGEYHFNREEWAKALGHYEKVTRVRRSRLYSFAYYKMAWTKYKLGQTKEALRDLEKVIRVSRREDEEEGGGGRIRLAAEAIKDLIPFYAEAGDYQRAYNYFERIVGEKKAKEMLEKLSYYYVSIGNRAGARHNFKFLIIDDPNSPKAYDYQYQIVQMYLYEGQQSIFREELFEWINKYGPNSDWAQANQNRKDLLLKSSQLMETTLRNYVLQLHQTAQLTKAEFSQKQAQKGYDIFLKYFPDSKQADEMHFFYAELLWDMEEFDIAADQYTVVAERFPKSKYREKSVLNALLALEKKLPSDKDIRANIGDTVEPVEFPKTVAEFISAAERYYKTFPKGEKTVDIKYRVATLHYSFNRFDDAIALFQQIVKEHPKTKYAEFSANLILDIYNLKKDYAGLEKAGQDILKVPELAQSPVGTQVKGIVERSSFKKAQELENQKNYLESAKQFQEFAKANPNSELVVPARFNAAVNFERAGDIGSAANMYALVLAAPPSKENDNLKEKSRRNVVNVYQQLGQYLKAAREYEKLASEQPKDRASADYLYNAAVIYDGLNLYQSATKNYEAYFNLSRKFDRIEIFWLLGEMNRRRKNFARARYYYGQYFDSNPRSPERVIRTAFLIGKMNELLGNRSKTDEWYNKTIAIQRRLARGTIMGVPEAAEARFSQVIKTFQELRNTRIPANPQKQRAAVQIKLNLLNRLVADMASVIKYDDGIQIVNALTVIGEAYQHMGESLYAVPAPSGLKPDELKEYQAGVEKLARPFIDKAIENYSAAVERSRELEAYAPSVIKANAELFKLDRQKAKGALEETQIVRLVDPGAPDTMTEEVKNLQLSLTSRDEDDMIAAASKILSADAFNRDALVAMSAFYIEQGKPGLAKIILNRVIEKHPTSSGALNNLAVILLNDEEYRPATLALKKAETAAKSSYTSANLGSLQAHFLDHSRCSQTLDLPYSEFRKEKGAKLKVWLQLAGNYGSCLRGAGDFSKAKSVYASGLEVESRNSQILFNYAILLTEYLKDKNEAQKVINRVKFISEDRAQLMRIEGLEKQLESL